MRVTLTIDRGNTLTKFALWRDGMMRPLTVSAVSRIDTATLDGLLRDMTVTNAIHCNVASNDDMVLEYLERRGIPTLDMQPGTRVPLTVEYSTPSTLGADRLAAAVGARELAGEHHGDILVVDVGTAVTYDVVTSGGVYRGGNIAPGIGLRLRALNNYTERLPVVDIVGDTPLWGHDTETALRTGAIDGVVAETHFYRRRLGDGCMTVLTGGSAPLVASRLDFDTIVEPDLVSIGLMAILNFNLRQDES